MIIYLFSFILLRKKTSFRKLKYFFYLIILIKFLTLMWLGSKSAEYPYIGWGVFSTIVHFFSMWKI
jgi:hypothetical protein